MNQRNDLAFGQREEEIFAKAIQISSAEKRAKYLREACGADEQLHIRLEQWIREYEQPDEMFADPDSVMGSLCPSKMPPERFGEFEIIRELGRGGMGIVYEARQTSLNRRVALKVLSVGLSLSKAASIRFQREAEAAGKLHHTNIVPVHTTGVQDGIPYYAMELVEGPSLDKVLKQIRVDSSITDLPPNDSSVPVTFDQPDATTVAQANTDTLDARSSFGSGSKYFDNVARAMADVAEALDHAHAHGVIHRDIKPSNLLLSPEGRVVINDFGLARVLEEPGLTMTGELMGSPRYMSPEQISSDCGHLDHRTDVYSLGVALYEFLTLRPAFRDEDKAKTLHQVVHKEPKAPRRIDSRIPVDLDTICRKAMEKDPAQRYRSAEAMADDLRRFVHRHSISARRIGPVGCGIRWSKRNKSAAALSLLLVLSILIGIMTIIGQRVTQARQEAERFQSQLQSIAMLLPKYEMAALRGVLELKKQYPDRTELNELHRRIGTEVQIRSVSAGVMVHVRSIEDSQSDWLNVGTTPLRTRLPRGGFHVKMSQAGRDDHVTLQQNSDAADVWEILLPTRKDMVRVAKHDAHNIIPWLRQRRMPALAKYQIDRFEVSNAEYQRFVDDGGYEREAYWLELLGHDWKKTVDGFRDERENKYLGPRFWISGTYPPTEGDAPVVGVSWYEAMAYANWVGKRLPTIFHWLHASDFSGWNDQIEVSSRSNIGRRDGAARANRSQDSFFSVGTNGVFDMAGNVKEWCLNEEVDGNCYALGGSWEDDEGSMHFPFSMPALERSKHVGFRCANYECPADLTGSIPIEWRSFDLALGEKTPIQQFQYLFTYDPSRAWNLSDGNWVTANGIKYRRFRFDTVYEEHQRLTLPHGQRMTCYVAYPDAQRFSPPYQTVIVGTRTRHDPKTELPKFPHAEISTFLRAGRAVVIPILFGTADREHPEYPTGAAAPDEVDRYAESITNIVKDFSRTVDFVENYERITGEATDIDAEKLAFFGFNWGGYVGPVWLVADELVNERDRFQAVVLYHAGFVHCRQPKRVDQLTYIPWLDTPVLMLTCKRTLFAPYEISQKPMYDALPLKHDVEKKLFALPKHVREIPIDDFDRHANRWLDRWFEAKPRLNKARAD